MTVVLSDLVSLFHVEVNVCARRFCFCVRCFLNATAFFFSFVRLNRLYLHANNIYEPGVEFTGLIFCNNCFVSYRKSYS